MIDNPYADPYTRIASLQERCARLQQALIDYDGVLATAVSELHAQARQQYADTAPGELVDRVSDLVEAAKATRAKHRALRASLPAREALAGPDTPAEEEA